MRPAEVSRGGAGSAEKSFRKSQKSLEQSFQVDAERRLLACTVSLATTTAVFAESGNQPQLSSSAFSAPPREIIFRVRTFSGRAGEIRTRDLLNPIQAHYQAVLRPDVRGRVPCSGPTRLGKCLLRKRKSRKIGRCADVLRSELRAAFRRIRATCGNKNNGEQAVPETDKNQPCTQKPVEGGNPRKSLPDGKAKAVFLQHKSGSATFRTAAERWA